MSHRLRHAVLAVTGATALVVTGLVGVAAAQAAVPAPTASATPPPRGTGGNYPGGYPTSTPTPPPATTTPTPRPTGVLPETAPPPPEGVAQELPVTGVPVAVAAVAGTLLAGAGVALRLAYRRRA